MEAPNFRLTDLLGAGFGGDGPEGADMGMVNLHAAQAVPAHEGRRYPERQRVAPVSYEQLMAERNEEEEELGDMRRRGKPKRHRLMGLKSLAEWAETWGDPKPQEECFACIHGSRLGDFEFPIAEMRKIIEMLRTCPAHMTFRALAVQVSALQIEMATRLNAHKPYGDPSRIPEWDPATANAHMRYHIPAPELQSRKIIGDLAELYEIVLHHCILQVDKEDGDISVNESASRVLERIVRMQQSVMKNDVSNMLYHAPNQVLEESKMGQHVATDQARFTTYLRKRKRGH